MPEVPNEPIPGIVSPVSTVSEAAIYDTTLVSAPLDGGQTIDTEAVAATLVGVPTT
ncbi:hypothetical protein GCM10027320_26510 [Massilia solisilvae]